MRLFPVYMHDIACPYVSTMTSHNDLIDVLSANAEHYFFQNMSYNASNKLSLGIG